MGGTRNGGCTFIATMLAPWIFARSIAPSTALPESSEPSVGTRIFLNMALPPGRLWVQPCPLFLPSPAGSFHYPQQELARVDHCQQFLRSRLRVACRERRARATARDGLATAYYARSARAAAEPGTR